MTEEMKTSRLFFALLLAFLILFAVFSRPLESLKKKNVCNFGI